MERYPDVKVILTVLDPGTDPVSWALTGERRDEATCQKEDVGRREGNEQFIEYTKGGEAGRGDHG